MLNSFGKMCIMSNQKVNCREHKETPDRLGAAYLCCMQLSHNWRTTGRLPRCSVVRVINATELDTAGPNLMQMVREEL